MRLLCGTAALALRLALENTILKRKYLALAVEHARLRMAVATWVEYEVRPSIREARRDH